jgi:hypothetical protein
MIPLQELWQVIDYLRRRSHVHGWYFGTSREPSSLHDYLWVESCCLLESVRHDRHRVTLSFLVDVIEDALWGVDAAPWPELGEPHAVLSHVLLADDRWGDDLVAFLSALHAAAASDPTTPQPPVSLGPEWGPAAWWNCTEFGALLRALRGRVGPRKMRLIACSVARHMLGGRDDRRGLRAIETAERHADGLASEKELSAAARAGRGLAGMAALGDIRGVITVAARHGNRHHLCDLVREVVGDPFRPPGCDPAWLRWHDGCVEKMVRTIYRGQRFAEMPILGDALEEAGCENAVLLAHCRQARNHSRGCWVLDALRGWG